MRNLEKYKGVIPAFYACYDNEGNVSPEGVQATDKVLRRKGVKVYTLTVHQENVSTRA